jgi:HEPN domain-containing protein
MKRNKKNEAQRWFLQAQRDLDDAKFNLSGERFNVACFLAQQSAEKAIKAYLIFKGVDFVWGHSVADLCEDAKKFDSEFQTIEKACKSLDKFYIPTRYPNALPGGIPSEAFDKSDAEKAISLAEEILKFVEKKLQIS